MPMSDDTYWYTVVRWNTVLMHWTPIWTNMQRLLWRLHVHNTKCSICSRSQTRLAFRLVQTPTTSSYTVVHTPNASCHIRRNIISSGTFAHAPQTTKQGSQEDTFKVVGQGGENRLGISSKDSRLHLQPTWYVKHIVKSSNNARRVTTRLRTGSAFGTVFAFVRETGTRTAVCVCTR